MSVLKIADEIDDLLKEQEQLPWGTKQVYLDLAATIIRQQQAEIEALKKEAALQRLSDFTQEAEKTLTDDYCKAYWGKDNCFVDVFLPNSETEVIRFWNDQLNESYEPKTLTNEEILDVERRLRNNGDFCELHFARAILRKAQEK